MAEALDKSPQEVREAYSLMRNPPQFELYDLKNDPYEFCNLARDPKYREVLERLQERLLAGRQETNDPFLNHENVLRLKEEIQATKQDGKYVKRKSPWGYVEYMAP